MSCLIAKIKDRKKALTYYKVLSHENDIFEVDITQLQLLDYEPSYKLDEGDWFRIEQFSQQPFCIDLLKKSFVSADHNDISKSQYADIAYLCIFQGENYFFQKVTPSLYLTRKTLRFGEKVKLEKNNYQLVIKELPDAIYVKSTDTLIFRNLATISSIFKGIDQLYREATNQEVTDFLKQPFIRVFGEYGVDKVSKPNRKIIALASTTLAAMSADEREQIIDYIDDYCAGELDFITDERKFDIGSDQDLALLLYGIEQRFYTTFIGGEKRVANSVRRL